MLGNVSGGKCCIGLREAIPLAVHANGASRSCNIGNGLGNVKVHSV